MGIQDKAAKNDKTSDLGKHLATAQEQSTQIFLKDATSKWGDKKVKNLNIQGNDVGAALTVDLLTPAGYNLIKQANAEAFGKTTIDRSLPAVKAYYQTFDPGVPESIAQIKTDPKIEAAFKYDAKKYLDQAGHFVGSSPERIKALHIDEKDWSAAYAVKLLHPGLYGIVGHENAQWIGKTSYLFGKSVTQGMKDEGKRALSNLPKLGIDAVTDFAVGHAAGFVSKYFPITAIPIAIATTYYLGQEQFCNPKNQTRNNDVWRIACSINQMSNTQIAKSGDKLKQELGADLLYGTAAVIIGGAGYKSGELLGSRIRGIAPPSTITNAVADSIKRRLSGRESESPNVVTTAVHEAMGEKPVMANSPSVANTTTNGNHDHLSAQEIEATTINEAGKVSDITDGGTETRGTSVTHQTKLGGDHEQFVAKGPIEKKNNFAKTLKERIEKDDIAGTLDLVCPTMPPFTKSMLEYVMLDIDRDNQASLLPGLKGDLFTKLAISQAKEYLKEPDKFMKDLRPSYDHYLFRQKQPTEFPKLEAAFAKYTAIGEAALKRYKKAAGDASASAAANLDPILKQYREIVKPAEEHRSAIVAEAEEQFKATMKQAKEHYAVITRAAEAFDPELLAANNQYEETLIQAKLDFLTAKTEANAQCDAIVGPARKHRDALLAADEAKRLEVERPAWAQYEATKKQAECDFFSEIAPLLHTDVENSKSYLKALNGNGSLGHENSINLLRLVKTFGNQSELWLDKQAERGNDFHDATYFLPLMTAGELKGLGEFLMVNRAKNIGSLGVVAKNWNKLSADEKKLPFDQVLDSCSNHFYPNVQMPAFAREAAQWGLDEGKYKEWEQLYANSLAIPSPFPQGETWKESGLVGRFLPRNDVRGIFLGEHTNCCQHPDGAGSDCAEYGQSSPKAGFFIVENEKTGQILAQSFTWVSETGGVCFDNIEAVKLGDREEAVAKVYEDAAKYLTDHAGFRIVTVGKLRSDVNVDRWTNAGSKTLATPDDYKGLSDAGKQVILSAQ